MGQTNRAWHERNRMPPRATMAQRIAWHRDHVRNCACRPIPDGVLQAMAERGLAVPKAKRRA